MAKRVREEEHQDNVRATKRRRASAPDRLSRLSDELVLRVFSQLDIPELVVCQRLSRKYEALAGDGQLWKAHYYNRFVKPRASRLPGLKTWDGAEQSLNFSSKASRWLEDEHLVRRGRKTNWKKQYKLRHNWSKGSCAVDEIHVSEEAKVPPVLVQMHDGIVYMADEVNGLRAWSAKGERKLIAQRPLERDRCPPTALTVEAQGDDSRRSRLLVGFADGSFTMYDLDRIARRFKQQYSHPSSSAGMISSVALVYPYALTMTATQLLSLYRFSKGWSYEQGPNDWEPPHLLHSLRSNTTWPPMTTSFRVTESTVTISIAYALPTYLSGWTVGIQEIRVDPSGKLVESRLASAIDSHYRPLAFATPPVVRHLSPAESSSLVHSTVEETRHIHSKPTSLSYTHPYLLVSHPDNTLTLYLVNSSADSLSIGAGTRLWGHTSSVSGAHVSGRGKAVSVGRRGDELRVWELEGGFCSSSAKKRLASGGLSVQLRPERRSTTLEATQAGLDLVHHVDGQGEADVSSELTLTRGWIGFDDENVVVLKEHSQGRQALVVYDFT